jgi:hypothetical protein
MLKFEKISRENTWDRVANSPIDNNTDLKKTEKEKNNINIWTMIYLLDLSYFFVYSKEYSTNTGK